jgi:hypothetical protein
MDFPLTHILSTRFCTNSISFTLCLIKIVPCSNLSSCFTWMKVHTRVGTSKWNDLTDLDEGVVSLMHVQNVAKKSICKTWSCEKMCRMPSVYNGEKFEKKRWVFWKMKPLSEPGILLFGGPNFKYFKDFEDMD